MYEYFQIIKNVSINKITEPLPRKAQTLRLSVQALHDFYEWPCLRTLRSSADHPSPSPTTNLLFCSKFHTTPNILCTFFSQPDHSPFLAAFPASTWSVPLPSTHGAPCGGIDYVQPSVTLSFLFFSYCF